MFNKNYKKVVILTKECIKKIINDIMKGNTELAEKKLHHLCGALTHAEFGSPKLSLELLDELKHTIGYETIDKIVIDYKGTRHE